MCIMSATVAAMGLLVASAILAITMYHQNQAQNRLSANISTLVDPKGPDIQFILFTNANSGYNLKVGDFQGLEQSTFNRTNPTKVIIHGYLSSVKDEIFVLMKQAYLSAGEHNIIGMDWSPLCEFEYLSALRGAQLAGAGLTALLDFLVRAGARHADLHLIGHSLGAHVAGVGAGGVKDGKRVARITGLDPAGPGFGTLPAHLRLDAGDARLVDVVHTYTRVLSLAEPLGHVDFYPNGGRFQPGCPQLLDLWNAAESIACNHGRAYVYFIESIRNPRAFRTNQCSNLEDATSGRCFQPTDVHMGRQETYKYGLYYVKTNDQPPFSRST